MLRTERALPALRRRAEDRAQPVALGPLVAAAMPAPARRLPVVRPVPRREGAAAADVAASTAPSCCATAAGSTASTAAARSARPTSECPWCRSIPSLLDVARLARALDPLDTIEPPAVYRAAARQGALQCAACGAALPEGETISCSQCGATLAITSLADANAEVQALAPALRAAAEQPSPQVVKRRLDALDAGPAAPARVGRRRWRRRPTHGAAGSVDDDFDWGSLLRGGTQPGPRRADRGRDLVRLALLALRRTPLRAR